MTTPLGRRKDRHALRLNEAVKRHQRSLSKPGVLSGLGLVPVDLVRRIVHRLLVRTRAKAAKAYISARMWAG